MKNKFLVLIGLGLVIFDAGFWPGTSALSSVHAQDPLKATVPASRGHCVASVPGGLVFEDSQAVVRMTDMQGRLQAQFDRN
jgi:hypothetical protein